MVATWRSHGDLAASLVLEAFSSPHDPFTSYMHNATSRAGFNPLGLVSILSPTTTILSPDTYLKGLLLKRLARVSRAYLR